jgi:hypothetical protein
MRPPDSAGKRRDVVSGVTIDGLPGAALIHYDPFAKALAKRERAHALDVEDVPALMEKGNVDREEALAYLEKIEPELYRLPALDPRSFRRRVEEVFGPR